MLLISSNVSVAQVGANIELPWCCINVSAGSHPSAASSRVLQRPSGVSMLAAASMPMVAGSSVSSAAVTMALSPTSGTSATSADQC